jgi:predicted RNA-binding protein
MPPEPSHAWVLTGSPENHAATVANGLQVIGLKERRRNVALEIAPGDRIFLYVTRRMAFAAGVRVTGELFEDRTPIWPGKPGRADAYPWRFPTEPEIVLDEPEWVPAEALVDELEHVRKWPREHWRLAFQGQIRPVSTHDAAVLFERMQACAGARA